VINGGFHAWVDRNNRGFSAFQAPLLQEGTLTLGVPATARRPLTVGNHNEAAPTPAISGTSGRGPTRDGRIKPELATVGTNVTAPRSRNMNAAAPGNAYVAMNGTSMAAPLAAGASALLFACRGAGATWADLKQVLEDTAGTTSLALPGNDFGFGFMQVGTACAAPPPAVDVWLRDHASDTGLEPFVGAAAWLSPDIELLDAAGNPVGNPTYDPVKRFNARVRVTVRNRGTQVARNTEVYLYWAVPATNIPYPAAWQSTGLYTGAPNFPSIGNLIVVPQLAPGATTQVEFGWAPPAPNLGVPDGDHFCLLVRLENEGDPSRVGAGGWASITARNNVGLRNVHVQPDDPGDADTTFYVVGSAAADSLIVEAQLEGEVTLVLPMQALPWRDAKVFSKLSRRQPYGCGEDIEPLRRLRTTLKGEMVQMRTDIKGAATLALADGIARVSLAGPRLHVPDLRVAEGARMLVRLHVSRPRIGKAGAYVHIAQRSAGQLLGGVSLERRVVRQKRDARRT
jgi:Subtilase family